MAKSKSSRRWLDRHVNDPYVKRTQLDGYRSRAAYKLLEIQEKDRLLRPGMHLVDLGAAPGSWSQIASRLVGNQGRVVALDILPMDAVPGVQLIQGDFREEAVLDQLKDTLSGEPLDLVLSDMAPNITGTAAVDQARAMYLIELALEFAREHLKPGGALVVKTFQGSGFDAYLRELRGSFRQVASRKPKSSRPESREVFLVAKGFHH
ncbi:23S rRNA (uridine(2552)-2'-O)-methyltransferase RlmE [Thiocystis violacea]|uniref:23S rRNA (uridine(2552)-2'-O)-methyltransferase RlmE n=1 Tax=Thiocystis violacea TaxID=13725 RepID=UPI001907F7BA|nr:23S rRNA (uridine(2552)-2'-O)-methyltransferase RlmE [Thiocystis violacea]MBK1723575.1 23S rRNA (uridine(2552)-2'-O)-methyltransferase [Thiocystis violacea]